MTGNPISFNQPVPVKEGTGNTQYVFRGWDITMDVKIANLQKTLEYHNVPNSKLPALLGDCKMTALFSKVLAVKETSGEKNFTVSELGDIITQAESDDSLGLSVDLSNSKIIFDNAAVKKIDSTKPAVLGISIIPAETLSKSVTSMFDDAVFFNVDFGDNKNFDGGVVTIKLPYNADDKNIDYLYVAYVKDDSVIEKYGCSYENGAVSFDVNHLSTYAVVYEEPPVIAVEEELPITYILIGAIAVLALAGGAIIVVKKRKA